MYKIKTLFIVVSLLSLVASCADDPEMHKFSLDPGTFVLYADQTSGTFSFETYDSWTAVPQVDWITIDGDNHLDVAYNYMNLYHSTVTFTALPNTTGRTRLGTILVKTYYSSAVPFYQLGVLNVLHPRYTIKTWLDEKAHIPDEILYELTDSANWEKDSICFKVEKDWELELVGDAPWIELVGNTAGPKGKNRVDFNLTPNTNTESGREAKLTLTSGEVSNEIVVRQLPAKKEVEE